MSIDELKAAATRWDLLKHSFYRRWTSGDLSMAELQDYASQYNFVVAAMPRWLAQAAETDPQDQPTLLAHARDEAAHIPMWADFAHAVGVSEEALAATMPNAATQALLQLGDDLVATGRGAAAVWALEAQTPRVSVEKLAGLSQYGVESGPGTRYFEVHRTMDVRHSEELERVIAGRPATSDAPDAAAEMSAALWDILTSVEAEVALA
ncbi:MAG: pyrroloquinoline-quinone synthase [Chloroflexota bacterium]|jgi:pyrroloquinoline quinone (PQQ) biosynthesis protein C|nr:pyrroloquinoline-quinone synthase [Chloroflexota bacterium]